MVALKNVFERSQKICVERIRPVGFCRKVAPVLVHPEPGRWVFSHIRLEGIPASLRDLLQRHRFRAVDLAMKNHSITAAHEWFAMHGDDRHAGLLMQRRMR